MENVLDIQDETVQFNRYSKLSLKYGILSFISFGLLMLLEINRLLIIRNLWSIYWDKKYLLNWIIGILLLAIFVFGLINTVNTIMSFKRNEKGSIAKIIGLVWSVIFLISFLWLSVLTVYKWSL